MKLTKQTNKKVTQVAAHQLKNSINSDKTQEK
jgi:hypothetical protein